MCVCVCACACVCVCLIRNLSSTVLHVICISWHSPLPVFTDFNSMTFTESWKLNRGRREVVARSRFCRCYSTVLKFDASIENLRCAMCLVYHPQDTTIGSLPSF